MLISDRRKAGTIIYRMGNTTFRLQTRLLCLFGVLAMLALFFYYINANFHSGIECSTGLGVAAGSRMSSMALTRQLYNTTYPLTQPSITYNTYTFVIGAITDLDTQSKSTVDTNIWLSYMKRGRLTYQSEENVVSITWDTDVTTLKSAMSYGGRGMELSELVTFNGKLYTVDDRTGVIYEIRNNKVVPWVILTDGDGHAEKGFKCEWATVKDEMLYVGGLGKEWTNGKGDVLNLDPQWVKVISPSGEVTHLDWHNNYNSIKEKAGIVSPGYMIHEAVVWSDVHKKWFFLPRRASKFQYNEVEDEERGTNIMITADETFTDIQIINVGSVVPSHGFSSFKFIPGSKDEMIVALKTEEDHGKIRTYFLAFNVNGDLIVPETEMGTMKYEGIEFC